MGINKQRRRPINTIVVIEQFNLLEGLLTFIDEKTHLNDFFTNKEIVFYKDINDLCYKLNKYKKDTKTGKKIARAGKQKYFKYFNSKLITKYIISKVYLDKPDKKIIW